MHQNNITIAFKSWGLAFVCLFGSMLSLAEADELWITYQGNSDLDKGKHIVLVSGDDEYRSEESLPQLAKILAERHGFKCTVLFAIEPESGTIKPDHQTNIPGLGQLKTADLMVLILRFRELPDDQMKHIIDYTNSGKPIIGLRTSTHAFAYSRNKQSQYAKYSYNSREIKGGYGRQVLGETWVNHHGKHGRESTRGVISEELRNHPILKGVEDIWGPTDVYGINSLTGDSRVLVHGQVLDGMRPSSEPVDGKQNDPMMPLVWIKSHTGATGKKSRVLCTTMGASVDLQNEGLRRLLLNACYWGMGLEDQIPAKSNVDYVGEYKPTFFGFRKYTKGIKPADHAIR